MKPKQPTTYGEVVIDEEIVIDARGTRIKTTREIIAKGRGHPLDVATFSSLFDPLTSKFLQAEDDGSYKIDVNPTYVEHLVALCENSDEELWRWRDFDKEHKNLIHQGRKELHNNYGDFSGYY